MLAKTFKSAEELKIAQNVHDALVKVHWMLIDSTIPETLFDMRTTGVHVGLPCGTAGCIIGWCHALDKNVPLQVNRLDKLCYPLDERAYKANPTQAAKAIHNYLTTGYPKWREALKA